MYIYYVYISTCYKNGLTVSIFDIFTSSMVLSIFLLYLMEIFLMIRKFWKNKKNVEHWLTVVT